MRGGLKEKIMDDIKINNEGLLALIEDLIRIKSVNQHLV